MLVAARPGDGVESSAAALWESGPLVVSTTLDANGGTTFQDARPGTYYLFGQVLLDKVQLVWDLQVVLKPGLNSETLDQRNATAIAR